MDCVDFEVPLRGHALPGSTGRPARRRPVADADFRANWDLLFRSPIRRPDWMIDHRLIAVISCDEPPAARLVSRMIDPGAMDRGRTRQRADRSAPFPHRCNPLCLRPSPSDRGAFGVLIRRTQNLEISVKFIKSRRKARLDRGFLTRFSANQAKNRSISADFGCFLRINRNNCRKTVAIVL